MDGMTSTETPLATLNAQALRDDEPLHYRHDGRLYRFYSSAAYRKTLAAAYFPKIRSEEKRLERFDRLHSLNDHLDDVITAVNATAGTIQPGQWALYNLRFTEPGTGREYEFLVEIDELGQIYVDLFI